MTLPLTDVKLYNYYRRYKWLASDFAALQDTLIRYPATLLASMTGGAVLSGFNPNGSSGLTMNYLAGVAMNSIGDLLAVAANGGVVVTNNVNSLIVVRPATANTNTITRPTTPFDPVSLNTEQTSSVVAIAGTLGVYPSKAAGDVILFGVTASGGSVTVIDQTQCELLGKASELRNSAPFNILVGNHRQCHYINLAAALAVAAAGDRIRVLDSETVNTTITCSVSDVNIQFDPNVVYTKGSAATGFTLSGNGIRFLNGRVTGFSSGGNKGINITGNYCTVLGTRFASNDTDVADSLGTSQQVGVINE